MMNCNSMGILMLTNLKKPSGYDLDSDLVDPTIFRWLIKSFMYLVNNGPYIFFTVDTLS